MEQITAQRLVLTTSDGLEVPIAIAGLGGRSLAFIIDWHIRLLLALAWGMLAIMAAGGAAITRGEPLDDAAGQLLLWIGLAPALAIYFLYHFVLEIAMQGRTPGKRMAGIRICDRSGHTPTVGALLTRNLFRLIDSLPSYYLLGLGVALFSRESVRIGDIAAGTLLVYEEREVRRLAAFADTGRHLPAEWRELLADLLERWRELTPPRRIAFAERLLEASGRPLPTRFANSKEYQQRLQLELARLQNGEPPSGS